MSRRCIGDDFNFEIKLLSESVQYRTNVLQIKKLSHINNIVLKRTYILNDFMLLLLDFPIK